jgi:uncharacterized protein
MTRTLASSRRDMLRMLAGVPLIPVLGYGAGATLAATRRAAAAAVKSVEFVGMPAPTTPAAQATTSVASSLVATYSDGSRRSFKLGYQPLFFTGDEVPDGNGGNTLAGGYYDIDGKPIMDASAATPTQFFSDCPDG